MSKTTGPIFTKLVSFEREFDKDSKFAIFSLILKCYGQVTF